MTQSPHMFPSTPAFILIVSTVDVIKVVLINIPLCVSNLYVMEPECVINLIAIIPTQKMCKTALTTGRCDRGNCFYYHKTGTIRRFPISQLQAKVDPPFLELNLPP